MLSNGFRARRTAHKQSDGIASTTSTEMNGQASSMPIPLTSDTTSHSLSRSAAAASIPSTSVTTTSINTNANTIRLKRRRKTRIEPLPISLSQIIIFSFMFLSAGTLAWILASSVFLAGSDKLRSFESNHDTLEKGPVSILVVGGSDGSGTRAFCWGLQQLGVTLLVDDKHTMDIEAGQLFRRSGWPGFVKYVLQETQGSLDYTWEDLSQEAQSVLKHEVGRFIKHLKLTYENMKIRIKHAEAKDNQTGQMIAVPIKAQRIHFAIKAPASMLVLPVLRHVFETELKFPVAFLHVVRDGRDVSLSQNQSPEQKFYNVTFPHDYLQRREQWKDDLYNVRAMQLWNDWNLQVWKNHHRAEAPNHDQLLSQQVEYNSKYLLVRSEDLVHSKWDVMQALHQFVDSSMPLKDLCCQSHAKDKDLGESVHFADVGKHKRLNTPRLPLRHPPRGRHSPGAGEGANGSDKRLLGVVDWIKESERVLQRERERDPRSATGDGTAESYTLEDLMNQGIPLVKQHTDNEIGELLVERFEDLVMLSHAKLDKDYKEWTHKFVTRNRSADAEEQTLYFTRTAAAVMDEARSLQHAQMSLYWMGMGDSRSDEVIKDIMRDLISRVHMLEDNATKHPFTRRSPDGDNYVDSSVLERRYGKWQGLLQNKPELSKYLHQEGSEGLRHFGYEPFQGFHYPKLDYECTQEQLVQCSSQGGS